MLGNVADIVKRDKQIVRTKHFKTASHISKTIHFWAQICFSDVVTQLCSCSECIIWASGVSADESIQNPWVWCQKKKSKQQRTILLRTYNIFIAATIRMRRPLSAFNSTAELHFDDTVQSHRLWGGFFYLSVTIENILFTLPIFFYCIIWIY